VCDSTPKKESKFKSITVEARTDPNDQEKTFDKIDRLAREKGLTNAAFLKELVEEYEDIGTLPLPRLHVRPIEVRWPKSAWETGDPFRDIFKDPGILFYKSIAWIRTEHYPQEAGRPQWPAELQRRVSDDPKFKFEKILIVSSKVQDNEEVWKWIFFWLSMKSEFKENFEVYVVGEDQTDRTWAECAPTNLKKLGKIYDMGIYGDKAIGFLELDAESRPRHYIWKLPSLDPAEEWTTNDTEACKVLFDTLKKRGLREPEIEKGLAPVLKGLARELTKHKE
jgi:hypothetical protein